MICKFNKSRHYIRRRKFKVTVGGVEIMRENENVYNTISKKRREPKLLWKPIFCESESNFSSGLGYVKTSLGFWLTAIFLFIIFINEL